MFGAYGLGHESGRVHSFSMISVACRMVTKLYLGVADKALSSVTYGTLAPGMVGPEQRGR